VRAVVKVGTSSITHDGGRLNRDAMVKLVGEIGDLRAAGHEVVLVSSAAIAAGMAHLGLAERPRDFAALQALSAVGQVQLMKCYGELASEQDMVVGQVLVAPPDFFARGRYLRARSCIEQQLAMHVLPIVNENDAVADDAIRFGDNDRIAALVAHLVSADILVLLTDTAGLLTADPKVDASAALIEEVAAVDSELEALAGGSTTTMAQGGMSSKISAAKIASFSGVETVIAAAARVNVLTDVLGGVAGVGTRVLARDTNMSARKLWIAFALASCGRVEVDAGAQRAVLANGSSLLPVGVTGVDGDFVAGDAVEVSGPDGVAFARGLTRLSSSEVRAAAGRRTQDLDEHQNEVINRDDLALLPT